MTSSKKNFRSAIAAVSLSMACLVPTLARAATVDPSTLDGKVLFGYQGWFGCPGTWGGGWSHWSGGTPSSTNIQVEMYPDLSEFPKADLCQAGDLTVGGAPAYLFSPRNINIVDKHFKWMSDYGLDGVLIQRFLTDISGLRSGGDVVLKNIMASSLKYGRVVAIEYDVTGSSFTTWNQDLENDWKYLVDQLHITSAPNYLHHKGRPLVSVWGVGLNETRNPPTNAADAMTMVKWFHTDAAAAYQASIMGGAPAGFRNGTRDARPEAGWLDVWKAMDAVQPWNVGRYANLNDIKGTFTTSTAADQKWLADAGITYMPVLFPGYSQSNASGGQKKQNEIPRLGGNFLWQQEVAAKASGAGAIKIAMFDEVNEATAMFKVVSKHSESPGQGYWLALDGDGMDLPTDWYLRLAGEITKITHGAQAITATIPIKPTDPYSSIGGIGEGGSGPARFKAFEWSPVPGGIRFSIKGPGRNLSVTDMRGAAVRSLAVSGGSALWDLRDSQGSRVVPGIYAAKVVGGGGGVAGNEKAGSGAGMICVP